ncbi:MAG: hypothetical protein SRB2_04651 [Desulfobacteraceae bacterium Eth-SRB2]|nr:MAG: hypothetical protein SRB2_04651 [Desulfobacteraceae bacterium Eth-SRB2]
MEDNIRKIRIRMNRSFTEFIAENHRKDFLNDLSFVTGVPQARIYNITFMKGCVIFEGELDAEAVDRLVEAYKSKNEPTKSEDIEVLRKFISDHFVVDITDDFKIKVTIRTSKKTDGKLLFVHGWRGDEKSFGKMPKILSDLVGCESLVYQYPTGIWEESPSIQYISRNLDNWIRNHSRNSILAIICHSMGGIVTRKLLVSQAWRENPIDKLVKQITFVASPHSGVPLAKLVKHVPFIRKAQISELSTRSSFLVDLNNQWSSWSRANVPNQCQVRSIYGTNDEVVDETLALGDDSEAIPILKAGHIDIVKPKDDKSEIVVTINRLIDESDFPNRSNA